MYRSISAVSLLALAACASASRTATPAPAARLAGTRPMQITVRGSLYTGTATLDSHLVGTFVVAGPVEVKGSVQGRAVSDSVTLDLTYSIAANNCKGTMKLTGTFASPSAGSAGGSVAAVDSCVGPMSGTFKIGQ